MQARLCVEGIIAIAKVSIVMGRLGGNFVPDFSVGLLVLHSFVHIVLILVLGRRG